MEIDLSHSDASYCGSEVIQGRVSLNLKESQTFKSLIVKFEGYVRVTLRDSQFYQCGRLYANVPKSLESDEKLVDMQSVLRENAVCQPDESIEFSFTIPENLANSFEHDLGKVSYSILAIATMPDSSEIKCMRALNIRNRRKYHVNHQFATEHQLDLPGSVSKSNTLFTDILKSDHVISQIRAAKTCFEQDEQIILDIKIENQSSYCISALNVSLIQSITFKAGGKCEQDNDELIKIKLNNFTVRSKSSETFSSITFRVPKEHSKYLPSEQDPLSLIVVQHFLVLTYKHSFMRVSGTCQEICIQ